MRQLRTFPLERREDGAAAVAAAAVRADLLPVRKLGAHELAAARAVLQRTEADLDLVSGMEAVRLPAQCRQLRGGAAFERPGCRFAVSIGDLDLKPCMG